MSSVILVIFKFSFIPYIFFTLTGERDGLFYFTQYTLYVSVFVTNKFYECLKFYVLKVSEKEKGTAVKM